MKTKIQYAIAVLGIVIAIWLTVEGVAGKSITIHPTIVFPQVIELGSYEFGQTAFSEFTISNSGSAPLEIRSIVTNCSCSGLESSENGQFMRVSTVNIGSLSSKVVRIRVTVNSPIGTKMINEIQFQTNDPKCPNGKIQAIINSVSGGIMTSPNAIAFGVAREGSVIEKTLDVYDESKETRTVLKVATSRPDVVQASVIAIGEGDKLTLQPQLGRRIGKILVKVDTSKPCEVNDVIHIYISGRERPDSVKIVGTIAAPIEFRPTVLTLPRRSSNTTVYSAVAVCNSSLATEYSLVSRDLPKHLDVAIADGVAGRKTVTVGLKAGVKAEDYHNTREKLHFVATYNGKSAILELDVVLLSP